VNIILTVRVGGIIVNGYNSKNINLEKLDTPKEAFGVFKQHYIQCPKEEEELLKLDPCIEDFPEKYKQYDPKGKEVTIASKKLPKTKEN
jgi:hypothetical protein